MILKRAAITLCLCTCLLFPSSTRGESKVSQEYALKAAFLYNFTLFTEWPASVGSTLKICTYGRDPLAESLEKLKGKPVDARTISVQRACRIAELKDCQVVFVSTAAIRQLDEIHDALKGHAVLTVTDSPVAMQGVAINMFTTQNKIAFEVNLPAVRNAGLNLSSKLLKLAGKVYQ